MIPTAPRLIDERRAAALDRLDNESQLWLATSSATTGPHLIPVSFVWDGELLTFSTFTKSRTAANVRERPTARVSIGPTHDVVIIDGEVTVVEVADIDPTTADRFAKVAHDPRVMPGLIYFQLKPRRILVWNSFHEFQGRTVMLDGNWLDDPVD